MIATTSLLVTLLDVLRTVKAAQQDCYYPNGDVSITDSPCSKSGTGACCPLNWECMTNGLCYYADEEFWGRYTCTDQSWDDPHCPQFCTGNNTAPGNEAIGQCDDGSWCCDGDRSVHCCENEDGQKIDVADGTAYTTITSLAPYPSVSSSPTRTSVKLTTTTTSPDSTSATPQTPSKVFTTSAALISTNPAGSVITTEASIVPASTSSTAALPPPNDKPTSKPKPLTLALASSLPLLFLSLLVALYLLYRRHIKHKHPPTSDNTLLHPDTLPDMYAHSKGAKEIDSYPIAVPPASSPESDKASNRVSELSGSSHFKPMGQSHERSAVSSLTETPGSPQGGEWSPSLRESGLKDVDEEHELPTERGSPLKNNDSSPPMSYYGKRYYSRMSSASAPATLTAATCAAFPATDGGGRSAGQIRHDDAMKGTVSGPVPDFLY